MIKNMAVTHDVHPERTAQPVENKPEYPNFMLGEKHIGKLGFKELPPVGTPLKMAARVEVTGSMMHDGQSGKERMLHLQITHMDLSKGGDHHEETENEVKGKKLYGDEKEK